MRAAAMDLGSNTLRLLVAEVGPGGWQALGRGLATPRLGAGLQGGKRLSGQAKKAAYESARKFAQKARALGAERVVLAATQACRKAADGADFVFGLGRDLDLARADVITGEQEARLSRLGVMSRLTGETGGAWIADIGGGSTELINLKQGHGAAVSLELGAVSLTQAFLLSDPPAPGELTAMERAVDHALAGLEAGRLKRLVATAGTAAALAALRLGMTEYDPERLNNLRVARQELGRMFERLAAMDLSRRRQALCLEPRRAEIILGGLGVLRGLVRKYRLDEFTVMDAGLLEGILLDDYNSHKTGA